MDQSGPVPPSSSQEDVWTEHEWSDDVETEDLEVQLVEESPSLTGLGMVKGVLAPVTLSMFSTILFLRIGYIVGNAGFLQTTAIFLISYILLGFTVLSICALATNGAVKGGGVYFMLSRTMGPEFGGSIGILFFMANIASSALNAVACTEGLLSSFGPGGAVMDLLPGGRWWEILYSSVLNILNLLACLVGAGLFGKISIVILLGLSICTLAVISSFFMDTEFHNSYTLLNDSHIGVFKGLSYNNASGIELFWQENWDSSYKTDCSNPDAQVDFFTVFGVVFSGVTGIMAGANLSGDLKVPAYSIPRGTLAGMTITFLTFMSLSILTALTCSPIFLLNDCFYMSKFTFWSGFVLIGVILATWSASLSNLIGASRLIQAIATDNLFGFLLDFVTRGTYKGNPIVAVTLTSILVQLCFFIGGLNAIAQLAAVLFLLSYAAVNLACMCLDLSSAPNFRPNFRFYHWTTCLVGLLGTMAMLFMTSVVFASVSVGLCIVLIVLLHYGSPAKEFNWGHISQALIFHQVRKYLLLLDPRKDHVKFWRPQMLLLVRNPRTSCSLIHFVNHMKKSGLYILGNVQKGDFSSELGGPGTQELGQWMSLVDHLKIKAFVELTMAQTVRAGVHQLIRLSGLGGMKPNTVILGFPGMCQEPLYSDIDDLTSRTSSYFWPGSKRDALALAPAEKLEPLEYVGIIADTLKMEKNLILCRHFKSLNLTQLRKNMASGYLDIWPINFLNTSPGETELEDPTSLFLMQIACIVHMVPDWSSLTLRLLTIGQGSLSDREVVQEELRLTAMLNSLRIRAKPVVIRQTEEVAGPEQANTFLRSHCSKTAILFLYLPVPPTSHVDHLQYLASLATLTEKLCPTLLVHGINSVVTTNL